MARTLLGSARYGDIRALAFQGNAVHASQTQIAALVAQHLSADHAALFAETVTDPGRDTIDWYARVDGEAVPLSALPAERRGAAEARLAQLAGDIAQLADTLKGDSDLHRRNIGHLLDLALQVPNRDHIRVIGEQPVLMAWGFGPAGVNASPEDLARIGRVVDSQGGTRIAPAAAAAGAALAAEAAEPPARPTGWWAAWRGRTLGCLRWLLLLFAFVVLLSSAFSLARNILADRLVAEQTREQELRSRLMTLGDQLDHRMDACVAPARAAEVPPPAPPPPPSPPPEQTVQAPPPQPRAAEPKPAPTVSEQEIDRRRAKAGGKVGELTISLAWNNTNDLDLIVIEPNGETLWFQHSKSGSGGELDVDQNAGGRAVVSNPIENATWNQPSRGHYKVYVAFFAKRSADPTPYTLTIKDGDKTKTLSGTVTYRPFERKLASLLRVSKLAIEFEH